MRAPARAVLLAALVVTVACIRLLPLAAVDPEVRRPAADGREHVYLGDYDSYLWLRSARRYLGTGTVCDAVVDGECRDTHTNAPVGARMRYARSLHVAAIVGVHRLAMLVAPRQPLETSAFLVPVIVGALGVLPAFAIGRRLAGVTGGAAAALVIGLNSSFLARSAGSDNDVWNVVLPLCLMWAAIRALDAARPAGQVAFATLAAGFAGLHAATWSGWVFAYGVALAGMAAEVVLRALGRGGRARGAALALGTFFVATGLFAAAGGSEESYLGLPARLVAELTGAGAPAPVAAEETAPYWPDVFGTVGELDRQGRAGIADSMGGAPYFLVGWLGLLALLLPARGWRARHFAVLIGGTLLYRWVLTGPELSRTALLAVVALPLGAAAVLRLVDREPAPSGGALVVAVWFLAALFLASEALRFVMLLAAPFGIAFGVAVGRAATWLGDALGRAAPRAAALRRVVPPLLAAAVLVHPVRVGYYTAREYRPDMNDAWWDTLAALGETAPPDAIVNLWWDYGYWTEYVADRRVTADGGSLRTHVPHWIGRALLAPTERESVGLLRMLDCGSDATPEPEGRQGAWGKLVAHGLDGFAAHDAVDELARLDAAGARERLAALGLSPPARDDVLASTHCTPPEAYLVLTTRQAEMPAWAYLGSWDLRRAWVARRGRLLAEADALAEMTGRLGYEEAEARAMLAHVRGLAPETLDGFIAPSAAYPPNWMPCRRVSAAGDLECRPEMALVDPQGYGLDAFRWDAADPAASRLYIAVPPGADGRPRPPREVTPAALILAGPERAIDLPLPPTRGFDLAVLLDAPNGRALVAAPHLLRATFTQLVLLDGRYARRFEKVGERTVADERVVTWRVRWEEP